jgi:hypothetical protein
VGGGLGMDLAALRGSLEHMGRALSDADFAQVRPPARPPADAGTPRAHRGSYPPPASRLPPPASRLPPPASRRLRRWRWC